MSSNKEGYQDTFQRSENARGIELRGAGERERVCVYDDRMAPRELLVKTRRKQTRNMGKKRDAKPVPVALVAPPGVAYWSRCCARVYIASPATIYKLNYWSEHKKEGCPRLLETSARQQG